MAGKNRKDIAIKEREETQRLVAWIATNWSEHITHSAKWNLHDNFIDNFHDTFDEWEKYWTVDLFRDQCYLSWEITESDMCILKGLFGIWWEGILDAVITGTKINTFEESKKFLTYALRGNLIGNEWVNAKTLVNILKGLKDYNSIFTEEAINIIIDKVLFEANQIYMGVEIEETKNRKADQTQWKDIGSAGPKWTEDILLSLKAFAKALSIFLGENKQFSTLIIWRCNSFIEKFYPRDVEKVE